MKLIQIIATATTAAVLGTAGVSIAGAATSGSSSPTTAKPAATAPAAKANVAHPRYRLRRLARKAFGLAAHTIGIPRADLRTEVRAGKTIGEVATAHGVLPKTVIDAIVKAADAKLEAAKAAGKLSTDRYNKLVARVPKVATRFVTEWHPKPKAP